MLSSDPGVGPGKRAQGSCAACGGCEGGMRELHGCKPAPGSAPSVENAKKTEGTEKADQREPQPDAVKTARPGAPDPDALRQWKVVQLRSYARKLPGFPMTANEIRYANKAALLEALARHNKQ